LTGIVIFRNSSAKGIVNHVSSDDNRNQRFPQKVPSVDISVFKTLPENSAKSWLVPKADDFHLKSISFSAFLVVVLNGDSQFLHDDSAMTL
jgi:hypothetical protein